MLPSCIIALTLGVLPTPIRADDALAAKIDAFIRAADYQQSRWGILVVDAKTGATVYAHNPEQLFLPASTTKLYSCAAALAAFGPDHRFETPVYQRGSASNGTLLGDLILVAKGDLTLGGRTDANGKMAFKNYDHSYANFMPDSELTDTDPLAGLKDLAHQVASAGIRNIVGDVFIDDRLFAKDRGTGSGPNVLSPIVVNDNVIDVLVTPGENAGDAAKVDIRPATPLMQIDAQIDTVAEGQEARFSHRRPGHNATSFEERSRQSPNRYWSSCPSMSRAFTAHSSSTRSKKKASASQEARYAARRASFPTGKPTINCSASRSSSRRRSRS